MDRFETDINHAVPLGLLLNEVVSNPLKLAFSGRDSGEIYVKLARNASMTNTVGGRHKKPASFGLRIMRLLIRQLEGDINIARKNGTWYTIHLPEGI